VCKCLLRVIQCGSEVELEVELEVKASVFEGEVGESQEGEAAEARDFLAVEAEVGETSVGKVVEPLVAEVVFEAEAVAEVTSVGEVGVAFVEAVVHLEDEVVKAEVVLENEVVEAEVVHADEEVEVALEGEVVAKAEADRVAVGGGKVEEALVGVAEAVATFAVEGAGISVDEDVEVSVDKVEV